MHTNILILHKNNFKKYFKTYKQVFYFWPVKKYFTSFKEVF